MVMDIENLRAELKKLIVDSLELEDVSPQSIKGDENLFGGGLGLDSIDGMELGMAIKDKWDVKFSDDGDYKKSFETVNSLAEYICAQKWGKAAAK
jgi:acyl carrier protein